jgi:hypothetical protein
MAKYFRKESKILSWLAGLLVSKVTGLTALKDVNI